MSDSPRTGDGRFLDRVLAGVLHVRAGEAPGDTLVARAAPSSRGAGVVWARDAAGGCLVVSNAHVVTQEPVVLEGRADGPLLGTLLARDASRDLALLHVAHAPASWRPIPPASAPVRAGQVLMAVGHPLGVAHAVTTGVAHGGHGLPAGTSFGRSRYAPAPRQRWLPLDLPLAPGNSGGPVVNVRGELVGVSTMIANGLGLAIPLDDIDAFVRRSGGVTQLAHGWTRVA